MVLNQHLFECVGRFRREVAQIDRGAAGSRPVNRRRSVPLLCRRKPGMRVRCFVNAHFLCTSGCADPVCCLAASFGFGGSLLQPSPAFFFSSSGSFTTMVSTSGSGAAVPGSGSGAFALYIAFGYSTG